MLWPLILLCSIAAAAPLAAQSRITQSALAGIELPVAAREWSADADGSKAATLDLAASLAGLACAAREAHVWPAADLAAAERLGARTEAAFVTAGWKLEPLSRTPEGQRILIARRHNERLVMVWQPEESEIGLLLCRTEPAAGEPTVPAGPPAMAEPLPPEAATSPAAPLPPDIAIAPPSEIAPPAETEAPPAETDAPPSRIDDAFGSAAPPPAVETSAPPPAETLAPPPPETPTPPPAVVPRVEVQETASDFNLPVRLVAVLLLTLGGVGLLVRDIRLRNRDTAWQWPTALTTIERGWIEEEEREDRRGSVTVAYLPVLKYRYAVDGEEFEGGQVGLDDRPQSTAEAARRILARYPNFSSVEIRYDPDDPSFAVIEAGRPHPSLEFYSGVAALLVALAILLSHFL